MTTNRFCVVPGTYAVSDGVTTFWVAGRIRTTVGVYYVFRSSGWKMVEGAWVAENYAPPTPMQQAAIDAVSNSVRNGYFEWVNDSSIFGDEEAGVGQLEVPKFIR